MTSPLTSASLLIASALLMPGGQAQAATPASLPAPAATSDGQHDFDFLMGRWKVHLRKLNAPLTGSTQWVEFDGTSVVRPLWDGRANLEEFSADSREGAVHLDGLTVRLYDSRSQEWRLYWVGPKSPVIDVPVVGRFHQGRGEFYDQELFNGRAIFVRYVWDRITERSAEFEQAFSADGGKTWEPNWVAHFARDGETPR